MTRAQSPFSLPVPVTLLSRRFCNTPYRSQDCNEREENMVENTDPIVFYLYNAFNSEEVRQLLIDKFPPAVTAAESTLSIGTA